eukprot:176651-Amphidinium_carterae.1
MQYFAHASTKPSFPRAPLWAQRAIVQLQASRCPLFGDFAKYIAFEDPTVVVTCGCGAEDTFLHFMQCALLAPLRTAILGAPEALTDE